MLNLNIQNLHSTKDIELSSVLKADLFDDLLNDYVYLQTKETSHNLEIMINEFNTKLVSFENVLQIYEHASVHGISQELMCLTGISEEGFFGTIGTAIKNFFKWLWDWCKRIYTFFKEKVFGITSNNKVDKAFTSPEEFEKIKKDIHLGKLPVVDLIVEHEQVLKNAGMCSKNIVTVLQENYSDLRQALTDENTENWFCFKFTDEYVKSNRSDACDFVDDIAEDMFRAMSSVNELLDRLRDLSSIDIDKYSEDQVNDLIKKINERFGKPIFACIGESAQTQETIADMKQYWSDIHKVLRYFVKYQADVKRICFRTIAQLCATGVSGALAGVFVRTNPPAGMVDKLRKIWEYDQFKLSTVVLTNMTSETIVKGTGSRGWNYSGGFSKSSTVFINPTIFAHKSNWLEMLKDNKDYVEFYSKHATDVYPMADNLIDDFISTVVHEARHSLQAQLRTAERDINDNWDDNKSANLSEDDRAHIEYLRKNIESEARRAAEEYRKTHISEEDRLWARKVISRAINQEIANLSKYRGVKLK